MSRAIQIIFAPTLEKEVASLLRAFEVRGYYKEDDRRAIDLAPEDGPTGSARIFRLATITLHLPDAQATGVLDELRALRRAQKHPETLRVVSWAVDVI